MRRVVPESFEWARALSYLQQCAHPFRTDVEPAMRWRFLPQLIAAGLRLSPRYCLLLPWLGVVLLLVGCGVALRRNSESGPKPTLAGLVLIATTAPVLCATGWLGINDAWVGIGLIVVGFSEPAVWLAAAVLLAPWVDERFWFGLPGALLVRFLVLDRPLARSELAATGLGILPYALLRLWGWHHLASDPSGSFLRIGAGEIAFRLTHAPVGWWMALRLAAIPMFIGWTGVARQKGIGLGMLCVAAFVVPLLALSVLAYDTMRSAGIALPWVLFGLLRWKPEGGAGASLTLIVLLQIISPVAQVTGPKVAWVSSLPIEIYRLAHAAHERPD